MKEYAHRSRSLGPETTMRMHDEFGVVSLDTVDVRDLQAMNMILREDPMLENYIGRHDFVVTIRDKASETGDGFASASSAISTAAAEESSIPLTLESNSMGESLLRLKHLQDRFGVRASKIILMQHGLPEGLVYGEQGLSKENMARHALGERFARLMVPGLRTGDKRLFMIACHQDTLPNGAKHKDGRLAKIKNFFVRRVPSVSEQTPAQVIANTAHPEHNLTVVAAEGKTTLEHNGVGVRYRDNEAWKNASIYRRRKGKMQREVAKHLPIGFTERLAA
jgi:hypothetical protein